MAWVLFVSLEPWAWFYNAYQLSMNRECNGVHWGDGNPHSDILRTDEYGNQAGCSPVFRFFPLASHEPDSRTRCIFHDYSTLPSPTLPISTRKGLTSAANSLACTVPVEIY